MVTKSRDGHDLSGLLANLPTNAEPGDTYFATDGVPGLYVKGISTWQPLGAGFASRAVSLNTLLTAADNGTAVIMNAQLSGTITLPKASTVPNMLVVIISGVATTNNAGTTVALHDSGDTITGGGIATPTAGKAFINTQATSKAGDAVELFSDGVATWWINSVVGIWARQA